MCSIYDNLRKGLGNVSKERCIFIFLTLLSIFAGSYCCNISATVVYGRYQKVSPIFIVPKFGII